MQILGILLVLINISAITAPVAGVAIVYQDHIQDAVIPPQLTHIINNEISLGADPTTLAEFVAVEFDNESRTFRLTINFTNPLNYDLGLKSLDAEVQCASHNSVIGQISLGNTVDLSAEETTSVIVICTWTQSAENHFQAEHTDEKTIDINLMGFTANFNDIHLQVSDPILVSDVPIV
jgi:hypothetical protein